MPNDIAQYVAQSQESSKARYYIKWWEYVKGDSVARHNYFAKTEDRMRFVIDMIDTNRMVDILEIGDKNSI